MVRQNQVSFVEVEQVITSEKLSLSTLKHAADGKQFSEVQQPEIVEMSQSPSCRPSLSECPLGCGHAHIEHPHLNMMYE